MRVAENEDETPSDAILHVPIHPQRMTSDIVYNVIICCYSLLGKAEGCNN